MSCVKALGLSVAGLSWPVLLGVVIGFVPGINPLFRDDRSRWFAFWSVTVGLLWLVAIVTTMLMARAGVSLAAVGLAPTSPAIAIVAGLSVAAFGVAAWRSSLRRPPCARSSCIEASFCGVAGMLGIWPANAIQAVLFAFHHGGVHQGRAAFAGRAAIGVLFGAVAMYSGTLAGVIALHYVVDAALAARPTRIPAVAPAG